jgi:hypothetical protein
MNAIGASFAGTPARIDPGPGAALTASGDFEENHEHPARARRLAHNTAAAIETGRRATYLSPRGARA